MEPEKQLSPEDVKLIDKIVGQLKSQGIFDQFRKECIADVDTKPAYQNLRQRVDGSVASFLSNHQWRPDLNKNQLRDNLRKHIQNGGFLDIGVERIVDQVVNPKIWPVFLPTVEQVVYDCLGVERPDKNEVSNKSMSSVPKSLGIPTYRPPFFPGMRPPVFSRPPPPPNSIPLPEEPQPHPQSSTSATKDEKPSTSVFSSLNDILPKDVEPVSPASDLDNQEDEDDIRLPMPDHTELEGEEEEEEISPPFEPHTDVHDDENSVDSHVSGMSELASHNSLNLSRSDSVDGKLNKTKEEGETEEDSQLIGRHSSSDMESSNDSYHEQKTPVPQVENSDHSTVEFTSVKEYHKYQMKSESNLSDDDSDSDNSDKEQESLDRKEWLTSDNMSSTNGRIPSDSFDEKTDGVSAVEEDIADGGEGETTGDEQNRLTGNYDVFTDYDDDVSNSSNLIVSASDNDAKTNIYDTSYAIEDNESEKSEDDSEKSDTAKSKPKNSSSKLKTNSKRHKSSHRDHHSKYEDTAKHGEKLHHHRHHHHHHRSKDKNKSERHSDKKDNRHSISQNIKEVSSRHDKDKQDNSSEKDHSKPHKKRKRDESSSKERSKDRKSNRIVAEDDEDDDGVNVSKNSKKHDKHKKHKSKHKRSRDHCKPRNKDKENRRSADRDSNGGQGEGSGLHATDSSSSNTRHNRQSTSLDKESYEQSSNSDNVSELCDSAVTEIPSQDSNRQMNSCVTPEYSGITNLKSDCSSEKENHQSPNNVNNNNKKFNVSKHPYLKRHLNLISYNSNGEISKFKKPKIAANIYEVRKIMQMRRYLKKLERQKQLEEEKLQEYDDVSIKESYSKETFYSTSKYGSDGSTELQLKQTGGCEIIQHEFDSISCTMTAKCNRDNDEDCSSDTECGSRSCDSQHSCSCDSYSSSCNSSDSDSNSDDDCSSESSIHSGDKMSDHGNCDFAAFETTINNNRILKDMKQEQSSTIDSKETNYFKGFYELVPETSQNEPCLQKLISELENEVKCAEEEAYNVDLVTSLLVLNPKFDNILEQQLGAKVIRKHLVVLPKFTDDNYDYDKESGYYILKKFYSKPETTTEKSNSVDSKVTKNRKRTLLLPKVKHMSPVKKGEQNNKITVSLSLFKQSNGQYMKHKRRYTDENVNSLHKDVPFDKCGHACKAKPLKISIEKVDEAHSQPIYKLENSVSCNVQAQTNNYIMKNDYVMPSKTKTRIPKTSEAASLENSSSRLWNDALDAVVSNNETGIETVEGSNQTPVQSIGADSEGVKDLDECNVSANSNKLTNQLIDPPLQNLILESGLDKGQGQIEPSQKKTKRLSSIDRLKLDAQRIMDMQVTTRTLKIIDSDLYKPRHIFGQRSRSRLRGIVNENIDGGETDAVTPSSSSSSSSSSTTTRRVV